MEASDLNATGADYCMFALALAPPLRSACADVQRLNTIFWSVVSGQVFPEFESCSCSELAGVECKRALI